MTFENVTDGVRNHTRAPEWAYPRNFSRGVLLWC